MEIGGDEAVHPDYYTGMTREDITKRLKDILGSSFSSSSRSDEADSVCHMVYGLPPDTQEAVLQLMQDSKATLIGSQSLPRAYARLLWPCANCGESGHSVENCPANSSADAAAADLAEADGAASSGRTKSSTDKKPKKRSKRVTKAQAENATTPTAASGSVADGEAAAAGTEGEAAAASDAAAKPAEQAARAKVIVAARQPAAEPAAAEDDDEEEDSEEGAAGGDDDLTSLINTFAPGRSKAGTKAGLAIPPPQPRDDANRSSSADAPDTASAVSSTTGGPADVAKDTEQPEQKDDGKRGRGRAGGRKKRGDSDVEQVWHSTVLDTKLLPACTLGSGGAVLRFPVSSLTTFGSRVPRARSTARRTLRAQAAAPANRMPGTSSSAPTGVSTQSALRALSHL